MKAIKHPVSAPFSLGRLRHLAAAFLAAWTLSQAGCAIHYRDAKTGTEHVWGLAHVKMRAAPSAPCPPCAASAAAPALATQVETLGFGLHLGTGAPGAESGLSLGWDRRTRLFLPEEGTLSLEWPTSKLFDVRVGSAPPFLAPAPVAPAPASP